MKLLPDIYFTPEYGRLYEYHESGTQESFSYKTAMGEVYFQFIRRPLDAFDGFAGYSDIVTPYGYGGPIFLGADDNSKPRLAAEFGSALREYCRDTKTVTAFVRFHPLLMNAPVFACAFDAVVPIRKTVAIDLSKDIFYEEFEPVVRNSYRSAARRRITVEYDGALSTLDTFIPLYYGLMQRKNAPDYYYFPAEYFEDLKKLGGSAELVNAVLDGEVIASALYLTGEKYIHTHLSASSAEGNRNRAMELIYASRALKAKEEGFLWNHLGGGFSNEPDDSLYLFKRKFSKSDPLDFYIGKSVYAPKVYEALCDQAAGKQQLDESYFPKYRANV